MADLSVRVRGVDKTVRDLARDSKDVHNAARSGVEKAAEHLKDVIVNKFGSYQPTGGTGGGPWAKLKRATILRKRTGDTPLIENGDAVGSIYVKPGGKGTLSASVSTSSSYLIHHIYGAPRAGVPRRDPFKVTSEEEKDACHRIILDEIDDKTRLGLR